MNIMKGTQPPSKDTTKADMNIGTIAALPNTKTAESKHNITEETIANKDTAEETNSENKELTSSQIINQDAQETNETEVDREVANVSNNEMLLIAQNANAENQQTLAAVTQSLRTLPGAFQVAGPGPYSQTGNAPRPGSYPMEDEGGQQPEDFAVETDAEACHTPSAYLVQDEDETAPKVEIAKAEKVKPYFQRKEGQLTIVITGALMACLVILLGVFLSRGDNDDEASTALNEVLTGTPTLAPTHDPRATLTVVQERGVVNCGIEDVNREGGVNLGEYDIDQCRALAATVFGDITKINLVTMGANDRYERLMNHEVDVLYAGDTYTLEKSIREPLMFVYPYYTAAVIYLGLETYVKCANDQKRFEECKDLAICAVDTPEIRSLITSFFPASFITFGTFPESEASLKNETAGCNVLVSDTYRIYGSNAGLQDDINSGTYVISDNHISRNLLSSVVRWSGESDDAVWIDIVEASRHAALRGNQVGLGKDESKCPMTSTAESEIAKSEIEGEINFFNGPYCVGNQMEEFQTHLGSIALSAYGIGGNVFFPTIDAPNFGSLECDDCEDVLKDGRLKQITERGLINCAVFLDPARNLTMTSFLTLVNVQFCKIMSVAIFQGDSDAVNISYIDKMDYSSFPQEYDIVAGVSWETRVGFNTGNLGTMDMSLPYFTHDKHIQYNGTTYDGIGEAKGFAVDVAEETLMEIAQSAVTATVYAQRNGISRSTYFDMPLMHLLGDSLTFMMRDVIMYAGNYDDIINEAFTSSDQETEIGWNIVIENYGPTPKSPIFFCDYFSNCPPCQWLDNEGYSVCIGILP